jgi:hypothetical protein
MPYLIDWVENGNPHLQRRLGSIAENTKFNIPIFSPIL